MKCLKCGNEFDPGSAVCSVCGAGTDHGEWVLLATAANDIEYEMLSGILQMADIPHFGRTKGYNALDGALLHVILGSGLPVEVHVPSDRYDEAKQLLNAKIEDLPGTDRED